MVTELRYVAAAELDAVRAYYRRAFRENGWKVVELDFTRGEWVFLVSSGRRVALVWIEPAGSQVRVTLELEAPVSVTPAPPPPDDDDDDDDDGESDD